MAKVQPEWIEGGPGDSLQVAYDKSTSGEILLSEEKGSLDFRAVDGAGDYPILTLGETGNTEGPSTEVSIYTAKLLSSGSVIEDSYNAVIIGGETGAVKGGSTHSMVIGSLEGTIDQASVNSTITNSLRAKITLASFSSMKSAGGELGTGSEFLATIAPEDYLTISSRAYNKDNTEFLDDSSKIAIPTYDGASEIRGILPFGYAGDLTDRIQSQRASINESYNVILENVDTISVHDSQYIHVRGLEPSSENIDGIPVRTSTIHGSNSVSMYGQIENSSVIASSSIALEGGLSGTGTRDLDNFPVRKAFISATTQSAIRGLAEQVSIVASSGSRLIGRAVLAGVYDANMAQDASILASSNGYLETATQSAIMASTSVSLGYLEEYADYAQSTDQPINPKNGAIVASNGSVISEGEGNSLMSAGRVTIMATSAPYSSRRLPTAYSSVIASQGGIALAGARSSVLIATRSAYGDEYEKSPMVAEESQDTVIQMLRSDASAMIGVTDSYGVKAPSMKDSNSSLILGSSLNNDTHGTIDNYVLPTEDYKQLRIEDSEKSGVFSSVSSSVMSSHNTSITSSSESRADWNSQSSIHSAQFGFMGIAPGNFDTLSQSWFKGLEYALNFSGVSSYGNHMSSMSSVTAAHLIGSNRSAIISGERHIASNVNDSAILGGDTIQMVLSDRSVSIAGLRNVVGPYSHDSVFGGGVDNYYAEVTNSVALANTDGDFRKTNAGVILGNTESSTNRVIRAAMLNSSNSSIVESTEASITGSQYSTIDYALNSSIQDSRLVDIAGNSAYAHVSGSNTVSVNEATQSSVTASKNIYAVGIERTVVQGSLDAQLIGVAVSVVAGSANTEIDGVFGASVIGSNEVTVSSSANPAVLGSYDAAVTGSTSSSIISSNTTTVTNGINTLLAAAYQVDMTNTNRSVIIGSHWGSINDSDTAAMIATRSSGINNFSHYSNLLSSTSVSINESEYTGIHHSENGSISQHANFCKVENSNSFGIIASDHSYLGQSDGVSLYAGNAYTSLMASRDSSNIIANETSILGASRGITITGAVDSLVVANRYLDLNTSNNSVIAATDYATITGVGKSSIMGVTNSTLDKVVNSSIANATYSTLAHINDSVIGVVRDSNLNDVDGAVVHGSNIEASNTVDSAIISSTLSEFYRSSLVSSLGVDEAYVSDSVMVSNVSSTLSTIKSADTSAISSSKGSTLENVLSSSLGSSLNSSIRSSSYSELQSSQYGEVLNSIDAAVIATHKGKSIDSTRVALLASQESHISYSMDAFQAANTQSTITGASSASILSSYGSTITSGAHNSSIIASDKSSIAEDTSNCSIVSSMGSSVSGYTTRGAVIAVENGSVAKYSHNSAAIGGRELAVSDYSEMSVAIGGQVNTLSNAARSSVIAGGSDTILNGVNESFAAASRLAFSDKSNNVSFVGATNAVIYNSTLSSIQASDGGTIDGSYTSGLLGTNGSSIGVGGSRVWLVASESFSTDGTGDKVNLAAIATSNGTFNGAMTRCATLASGNFGFSTSISSAYIGSESGSISGCFATLVLGSETFNVGTSNRASLLSAMQSTITSSEDSSVVASLDSTVLNSKQAATIASDNSKVSGANHAATLASKGAIAANNSEVARANDSFGSQGDAQTSNMLLRGFTDDLGGAANKMQINESGATGAGGALALEDNSAYTLEARVVGKGDTGALGASHHFQGLITISDDGVIDNDAVQVSYTGSSSDTIMNAVSIDFVTETVSDEAFWSIEVPSVAGVNTRWLADVTLTKVTF